MAKPSPVRLRPVHLDGSLHLRVSLPPRAYVTRFYLTFPEIHPSRGGTIVINYRLICYFLGLALGWRYMQNESLWFN